MNYNIIIWAVSVVFAGSGHLAGAQKDAIERQESTSKDIAIATLSARVHQLEDMPKVEAKEEPKMIPDCKPVPCEPQKVYITKRDTICPKDSIYVLSVHHHHVDSVAIEIKHKDTTELLFCKITRRIGTKGKD